MPRTLGLLLYAEHTVAELIELGQLGESLGYDTLWYTDLRLARDCYIGLSVLAAHTNKVRLGPCVSDPYTRHPAITASAIAAFDEICDGRAVLGLGTGGQGFEELGLDNKLPVAGLREAVTMINGLLRGEKVNVQGKVVTLNNGQLNFTPVRDHIPIYFATHGAQVSKLAGTIADGVLIANTLLPNVFEGYAKQIGAGLESAGKPAGSFDMGLRVEACISDDYDAAFAVMRRRMAHRLMGQFPRWDYLNELGVSIPAQFSEIAAKKDNNLIDEAAAAMPAEIVDYTVLAGDVERVAQQLARVLRPEITHLVIRPHKVPGDDISTTIKLFAEAVVPRVEQLLAANQHV